MANPQPDIFIGWSKELWGALLKIHIPSNTRRVFDAIALLTYGANPRVKEAQISNQQIIKLTGLGKVAVSRGMQQLFIMGLVIKNGNYAPPIIRINKDYENWKQLPKTATPNKIKPSQRCEKKQLPKTATKVAENGNSNEVIPIIYIKEKEIAVSVFDFYKNEILPLRKSRKRAVKNIEFHLKKYPAADLKKAVLNYKPIAKKSEPEYRKDPANFFGYKDRDQYFVDYLPGNYEPPKSEKPEYMTAADVDRDIYGK